MPIKRARLPCAIANALVATWVTHASAPDRLAKQAGFLQLASFNIYKLGGIRKRYKKQKGIKDPQLPLGGEIPERIRNLARVLTVGNFDLVALQESTRMRRVGLPCPTSCERSRRITGLPTASS